MKQPTTIRMVEAIGQRDVAPWVMPMCFSDIWGPRRYDDRGHLIALPGAYMHWRCPTLAEIRWQIWETIRSRGKGVIFYTLAPEAPDPKTASLPPPDIAQQNDQIILAKEPTDLGPNALTNPDGTATPQLEEIGRAYRLIAAHKALIRRWRCRRKKCLRLNVRTARSSEMANSSTSSSLIFWLALPVSATVTASWPRQRNSSTTGNGKFSLA